MPAVRHHAAEAFLDDGVDEHARVACARGAHDDAGTLHASARSACAAAAGGDASECGLSLAGAVQHFERGRGGHGAVSLAGGGGMVVEDAAAGLHVTRSDVVCPICKRARLFEAAGVIYCPCGGLRLDTAHGMTLRNLSQQLEAATLAHAERCRAAPTFGMSDDPSFCALCLTCDVCNDFQIVV